MSETPAEDPGHCPLNLFFAGLGVGIIILDDVRREQNDHLFAGRRILLLAKQRAGQRLSLFDDGLGQSGCASQRRCDHVRNTAVCAQCGRDQCRTLLGIGRVRRELLAHSLIACLRLPSLRELNLTVGQLM